VKDARSYGLILGTVRLIFTLSESLRYTVAVRKTVTKVRLDTYYWSLWTSDETSKLYQRLYEHETGTSFL